MKRMPEIIIALLVLACATVFAAGTLDIVTVGTSQTLLSAATGGAGANSSVTICVRGTNTVYIKYDSGTNALTTTNGIPIYPGTPVTFANDSGFTAARNNIYGISTANTDVSVSRDDAK